MVLKYFIKKEGQTIRNWFETRESDRKGEFQHFIQHAEHVTQNMKDITKPTVISACKTFDEMEIFGSQLKIPHLQSPERKHFYLKSDLETIRKLVEMIIEKFDRPEIIYLLGHEYFMHNINESLIKQVLAEKEVMIKRRIPILEWNEIQLKEMISSQEKYEEKVYGRIEKKDFHKSLKKSIDYYEEENRQSERDHLKELRGFCNAYIEKIGNDTKGDINNYYVDKEIIGLLRSKENSQYITPHKFSLWNFGFDDTIKINLPVFRDDVEKEEVVKKIYSANESLLDDYPYLDLKRHYSGVENHYNIFQYEKLILPILAFIQISPSALAEFLYGKWESFELIINTSDECENYGLVSRLLQNVIIDIYNCFIVLRNGIVENVCSGTYYLGKEPNLVPHEQRMKMMDSYYQSLSFSELLKLENPPLIIQLKNLYELNCTIGFAETTDEDMNHKRWTNINLSFKNPLVYYLINLDVFKDTQGLISKLQNTKNPLYKHVRGKLSNFMQHIIQCYSIEQTPSIHFKEMLAYELNLALTRGDFYEEQIFDCLKSENEFMEKAKEYLSNYNYSKKKLVNEVYGSYFDVFLLVTYNRYFLEKVFPEEIDTSYSVNLERQHDEDKKRNSW